MKFSVSIRLAAVFVFLLIFSCSIRADDISANEKSFSFSELQSLYDSDKLSLPLKEKLNLLLTTPFVNNSYSNRSKPKPYLRSEQLGEYIRVVHWNIERGIEFEAIKALLSSEKELTDLLDVDRFPPDSPARQKILEQASYLRSADVIVLNDVDWGVKRSGYMNVAASLAEHLKMNYAMGVQFVELSPIHMGQKELTENREEQELLKIIAVDPEKYKGGNGIAILSRFPLENVRLVPFEYQSYDWFAQEKKGPGLLEKGKRKLARNVFLERTLREVRRGGRGSLLADVVDERLPTGRVTVAATHLENRTEPKNRLKQMNELLEHIKDSPHPVILAGDLNTSASDLTPTNFRREFIKRFGSPSAWIKSGVNYALGLGMIEDILISGVIFGLNQGNPTARHIPIIAPNEERKLFSTLKKFRFNDGGAFDFRGDRERTVNNKGKELSNSNHRLGRGFVTTYQVQRPIVFVGKYKLDWIFVKPPNLKQPKDKKGSYQFAPHFGRTLTDVNNIVEGRISDHRPMVVELPLMEPNI